MSGRYMSKLDIAAAKHREEIFNSMIKRGEIDPSTHIRTAYVVCGCGEEGCGFITRWLKEATKKASKSDESVV